MHSGSMAEMTRILKAYSESANWGEGTEALDVGSLDVNGSYRKLVESYGITYTGIDVVDGANVDILSSSEYSYPLEDSRFDLVISGSTMEHVRNLWLWVPELVRVLKPGGLLAIITHTQWQIGHHYPDCWRILPDGMKYLFDMTEQLEEYDIRMYSRTDISGVATKILEAEK